MSTNGLLKWITFHLKLHVSSILNKFIKFMQCVPTIGLLPATNQTQWMAAIKNLKHNNLSFYNIKCPQKDHSFTLNIYLNIKFLPPLTILFQENINTEHVQLGAHLQGE